MRTKPGLSTGNALLHGLLLKRAREVDVGGHPIITYVSRS